MCSFMGHCSDRGKLDHQNQQKSLFLLLLSLLARTFSKAALLPSAGFLENRRSLSGHPAALASGQLQAGQTSALASRHCPARGFAFTTYSRASSTVFWESCIIIFFTFKSKCDASKEVYLCSQAGWTPLWKAWSLPAIEPLHFCFGHPGLGWWGHSTVHLRMVAHQWMQIINTPASQERCDFGFH